MDSDRLRPIEAAENAVESVRDAARGALLDWLPTPHECPECGVHCKAGTHYDPQQAAFYPNGEAPVWICPECDRVFRRGDDNPMSAEMWDR